MENVLEITSQQQINTLLEQDYPKITSIIFSDWQGKAITNIPDNFFNRFLAVLYVQFNMDIENLPDSLYNIVLLKRLEVNSKKIKTFSNRITALKNLEYFKIHYDNKQLNWSKEFPKLALLPALKHFELPNIRGSSFPAELALMSQLKTLKIGHEIIKKCVTNTIVATVAKMKNLKKIELEAWYNSKLQIDEGLLQLDFLEEIKAGSPYDRLDFPPFFALFKNAKVDIPFTRKMQSRYQRTTDSIANFLEIAIKNDYSDLQRKVLFCFWIENFHALRALVPNILLQQHPAKLKIALVGPTKRDKPKQIIEALKETNVSLIKIEKDEADILVILSSATFEEIDKIINSGKNIIIEDQLNEYITSLGQHYLLAPENEELNEELVRLLASNQLENYLLAFQIIESGGANKTIQSLLAAIYLAHPDKKVQKEVTKQYEKYCTIAYQEYVKKNQVGISLRKSGNSGNAFNVFSKHTDVNRMEFILMYHRIAAENPVVKDVDKTTLSLKNQGITKIPEIFRFFNHISSINLEKNPSFNLTDSVPFLAASVTLQELNLAGSHIYIPDLSSIKSLKKLDVSFNQLDNYDEWLPKINLEKLDIEGCKIDKWDWLSCMKNMSQLNISGNIMVSLPTEAFQLPLTTFICRNNKLKLIDDQLELMSKLETIDFANNEITEFKYFFLLKSTVNLRSNNIALFEPIKYSQALKGKKIVLKKLDLANNKLQQLEFGQLQLNSLSELDISGNQLVKLDDSIFNNTSIRCFEANNNQIEVIPESATHHSYTRFWLEKNKIKELSKYLNVLNIGNLNLNNNLIEKIDPSFFTENKGYSRSNWKIDGNPVCKMAGFSNYNFLFPGKL